MSQAAQRKWKVGALAKVDAADDAKYNALLATVPRTTHPTTLADFKYEYSDDGRLVQSLTKEPFAWLGQKHYDFLGDAIVNHIYSVMQSKYGLKRVDFPLSAPLDDGEGAVEAGTHPTAPVFVSDNYLTAETLVILCQGSGAVRPGMWARALCINNSLKDGTIFTYLEDIASRGWGVIVCNPNENTASAPAPGVAERNDLTEDDACEFWLGTTDADWKAEARAKAQREVQIPGSTTPMEHMITVWDQLVRPANAARVPIIAHSFGGRCTTALVNARFDEVAPRVPAIAWTDAINDMFRGHANLSPKRLKELSSFIQERSINWVASDAPLDTPERSMVRCQERSAGHNTHEWTSSACRTSVFKFLDSKTR